MIVNPKFNFFLQESKRKKDLYLPTFFKLTNKDDQLAFNKLLQEETKIEIYDEIEGQLEELIKSLNPKVEFKSNPLLLKKKIADHIGTTPFEQYGIWVYYPWSSRLIHILDKEEFIEVRTNRNQYKITKAERDVLATKKVGVMGLSVGQSVAITMAMERGFGEIRLGDFDVLELTNYNRIRVGLHNMGLNKAISVAREISEIDPFLKVRCFTNGITEENMEAFLIKDGKLDLLIDECDGLHIKILSRIMAKRLEIPVIMEASDRSAIDVERFDLEPERPILHGWLDHLDVTKVKEAKTNEQKIPYLLAMLKLDTVSPKFKATMLEIEQTVTTWPQLASEVTLGGGIMANISRRINLNQFNDSGRYYVDIDELIADKNPQEEKENYIPDPASIPPALITIEEMKRISDNLDFAFIEGQVSPDKKTIEELITAASLAPSGGNNQPWKWMYKKGVLLLFHDESRSVSFLDYANIGANISFGAALENLSLIATKKELKVKIKLFPVSQRPLVAQVNFFSSIDNSEEFDLPNLDSLVDFIGLRCTNRQIAERQKLSKSILKELTRAVHSVNNTEVIFFDDQKEIEGLTKLIAKTERLRFMHPDGYKELFVNELRWSSDQNNETHDGIDIESFDLTPSESIGMVMAKDERVIKLLSKWKEGKGFEKFSSKTLSTASVIGVIRVPSISAIDCINGGKALERLWLCATKNSIQLHPYTTPIFLYNRLIHGNGIGMTDAMKDELEENKKSYNDFLSGHNIENIFLFRLFIGGKPVKRSLRRNLKDILCFDA